MQRLPLAIAIALSLTPMSIQAQQAEDDVEAKFRAAFGDTCLFDDESSTPEYFTNERWDLTWQEEYSDTPSTATLYQFFCFAGAYNINAIYYLETELEGAVPVSFAVPSYDVKYVDDDFNAAVESINVRGFTSQYILTNSEFDPEAGEMQNYVLWRGIGDASEGGTWVFDRGNFVLKRYDVDASYDDEMNPERIVEFK